MQSNHELVSHLITSGVLRSGELIEAFEHVDRADFVPPQFHGAAYEDHPLPIGFGQTISQPYTVAFMLEALHPLPVSSVLDIGAGSGWTAALLAQCSGHVTAVERIPELVELARSNLSRYHPGNITLRQAQAALGTPGSRYDRILVSAAAEHFPHALLEQLEPGGIMVVPISHAIVVAELDEEGNVTRRDYPGFAFVPLIC